MKSSKLENAAIREKVQRGLDITFEKLLKTKSKTNGVLVFSQDGVIKKINASELTKK